MILTLFVVLITYLVYKWVVEPLRAMKHYQTQFKLKGHKVAKLSYQPWTTPFFDELFQDQQKHKDPLYRHKNYYPSTSLIVTNTLANASLVLLDIELIKETYHPDKFHILEKERNIFGIWLSVFNRSLLGTEKLDWKAKRKLLSKVFTHDTISAYLPEMVENANQAFQYFENKYWSGHPEDKQKGFYKVELNKLMARYASSVVIAGFLGTENLKDTYKGEPVADAIIKMSYEASHRLGDPLVLILGEKFVDKGWRKHDREYIALKKDVKNILKHYIAEQEKMFEQQSKTEAESQINKPKKIIRMLLEERRNQPKGQGNIEIDIEYLMDEIKSFVIAGTDTTTSFITNLLLQVFERPAIAQKLKDQINQVIKSDADITMSNFKKIPYLECIINETSRFSSSIFNTFTKIATEDITIGGVLIKKGTMVDSVWTDTFYNPDIFQNPTEFIPERWENEECKKHQHLIGMIFGSGPRACIGKGVALANIKTMVIKFMQRYDTLTQVDLKNRAYEFIVSYCVKNTESIITIKK